MKSLYAQYIAERENKAIIESENGFATYKIYSNGECYLQDLYVVPEMRKSNLATQMTNTIVDIAKENGCHTLVGSVCVDDRNATINMSIFIKYGMKIDKLIGNVIFLKKDIGVV